MIVIYKNPNGDTRTAPSNVTFEQFQEANDMHKEDVRQTMDFLSSQIKYRGLCHDYTKKSHEKQFFRDFLATKNNGDDFINNSWYQMHIEMERHHLLSRCPDDVDLIDVIEMIVDCVCAGRARSGELRPIEINDDILRQAIGNTVKKVDNIIISKEMKPNN